MATLSCSSRRLLLCTKCSQSTSHSRQWRQSCRRFLLQASIVSARSTVKWSLSRRTRRRGEPQRPQLLILECCRTSPLSLRALRLYRSPLRRSQVSRHWYATSRLLASPWERLCADFCAEMEARRPKRLRAQKYQRRISTMTTRATVSPKGCQPRRPRSSHRSDLSLVPQSELARPSRPDHLYETHRRPDRHCRRERLRHLRRRRNRLLPLQPSRLSPSQLDHRWHRRQSLQNHSWKDLPGRRLQQSRHQACRRNRRQRLLRRTTPRCRVHPRQMDPALKIWRRRRPKHQRHLFHRLPSPKQPSRKPRKERNLRQRSRKNHLKSLKRSDHHRRHHHRLRPRRIPRNDISQHASPITGQLGTSPPTFSRTPYCRAYPIHARLGQIRLP